MVTKSRSFLRSVPTVMDRYPRVVAGGLFALLGCGGSGLPFLIPSLQRGFPTLLLFVGLPTLAGGAAGAMLGPQLIRHRPGFWQGLLTGAGWGLLATLLAMVLFAPLFSLGYVLASWSGRPGYSGIVHLDHLPALIGQVGLFSFLAMGPLAFPLGAIGGVIPVLLRRLC